MNTTTRKKKNNFAGIEHLPCPMLHVPCCVSHVPCDRRGQMLIEALIAISILTIGLMGVLGLLNQSLRLNAVVADNYRASYLASEGVEIVKNIIDHNNILNINNEIACNQSGGTQCSAPHVPWNQGISDGNYEVDYQSESLDNNIGVGQLSTRPLNFDDTTKLYGYGSAGSSIFSRTVSVKLVGGNEVVVTSTVTWSEGVLQNGRIDIGDTFYDWWPSLATGPATGPTAKLTANGSHNTQVHVGKIVNYFWSSTNASSWAGTFTVDTADGCGYLPNQVYTWGASPQGLPPGGTRGNTANGNVFDTVGCWPGGNVSSMTYHITYTVKDASGNSASDSVLVTVLP